MMFHHQLFLFVHNIVLKQTKNLKLNSSRTSVWTENVCQHHTCTRWFRQSASLLDVVLLQADTLWYTWNNVWTVLNPNHIDDLDLDPWKFTCPSSEQVPKAVQTGHTHSKEISHLTIKVSNTHEAQIYECVQTVTKGHLSISSRYFFTLYMIEMIFFAGNTTKVHRWFIQGNVEHQSYNAAYH